MRNAVVEEGSNSCAGGGEPFDEGKAGLGQGDSMRKVVLGVQCQGEPVAEPPDYPGGAEDETI